MSAETASPQPVTIQTWPSLRERARLYRLPRTRPMASGLCRGAPPSGRCAGSQRPWQVRSIVPATIRPGLTARSEASPRTISVSPSGLESGTRSGQAAEVRGALRPDRRANVYDDRVASRDQAGAAGATWARRLMPAVNIRRHTDPRLRPWGFFVMVSTEGYIQAGRLQIITNPVCWLQNIKAHVAPPAATLKTRKYER